MPTVGAQNENMLQATANLVGLKLSASVEVKTVSTTAYKDQKPGTSGLRKKVAVFRSSILPNETQLTERATICTTSCNLSSTLSLRMS